MEWYVPKMQPGGDGKVYGGGKRFHGAFCLAIAQPPRQEIVEVLDNIEYVGRASLAPGALGFMPLVLRGLPDLPPLPFRFDPIHDQVNRRRTR